MEGLAFIQIHVSAQDSTQDLLVKHVSSILTKFLTYSCCNVDVTVQLSVFQIVTMEHAQALNSALVMQDTQEIVVDWVSIILVRIRS